MPAIAEPPVSVVSPTAPPAPAQPELKVSQIPPPITPMNAPKPGSAREKLHESLRKKSGIETPPAKPEPEKEKAKAPVEEPERPGDVEIEPGESNEATPETKETKTEPVTESKDGKKPSPWKLFEAEKKARVAAESEVQRLRSLIVSEPELKAREERLTKAETRAKELEDEMRFVNYAKSQEFKEKHQVPYENAWQNAMSELSEITIEDPTNHQQRAVTAQDLMELVNMPLGKAREVADSVFGTFANDVLAHRKEIKDLFMKQSKALEEAKTHGAERESQRREQIQKMQGAVTQQVKEVWDKAHSSILEDPQNGEYFKPRDGDQEWNDRLTKGYTLADKAIAEIWAQLPMDPRLTPEQRAEAVKRHAAVRARIAGWGPLKAEVTKLKKALAERDEELKKYKSSTPAAGGTAAQSNTPVVVSARQSLREGLAKLAH